jgi:nucleoside-diphosphate-sugar epimerase
LTSVINAEEVSDNQIITELTKQNSAYVKFEQIEFYLNKNQFNDFISNEFPPIINVGSGDEITIIELAQLIKEVVMYKGDIVFDKTLDGVKSKLICSEKIKALNWKSKVKLKDGILIAYRDFLTHK